MLSALEEQVRAQLTFQSYDHAQWLLAFGPEEALAKFIALPKVFRKALKKTWLGFSDQVPFWVKTTSDKNLFAAHETDVVHQSVLREAAKVGAGLASKSTELVQKTAETQIVVAKPIADQGGQRQLRKQAESQDDKYRVTYEARQVISGAFIKNYVFCVRKNVLLLRVVLLLRGAGVAKGLSMNELFKAFL